MGEASEAHYLAERAEHLRNADEELEGGVGEDIGIFRGVAQRRGDGTYFTQAEVDEIMGLPDPRRRADHWDRFLRELDDRRVEVGKGLLLPVLNKEGGMEEQLNGPVPSVIWGADLEARQHDWRDAREAALAALRRFTTTPEVSEAGSAALVGLYEADARLEAAERALKEAG